MYVLVENGNIVKTASNYKVFFPNISFPRSVSVPFLQQTYSVYSVVEGERKDERFYWVTPAQPAIQLVDGVPTRLYVNTPKDLNQLKEQWTTQAKEDANKALAPTDWMVIRKAERDVAIPEDVVAARTAIIEACAAKEAAIAAATTVDELKDALFPVVEAEPVPEPVQEFVQEVVPEPTPEPVPEPVQEEITIGTATSGNADGEESVIISGNSD